METRTKEILDFLGNTHTKVEAKEDFNGNYYSYITDTIYISKNYENRKAPKNINKVAASFIVVCHECIHSMQSRLLHVQNIILSNLSIILFCISLFLSVFEIVPLWIKIITFFVTLTSIVIRVILELGAINGSITLANSVVSKNIFSDISKQDIEEGSRYIARYKWIALLEMNLYKIICLILILIIK